jgi:hypothetical protein
MNKRVEQLNHNSIIREEEGSSSVQFSLQWFGSEEDQPQEPPWNMMLLGK